MHPNIDTSDIFEGLSVSEIYQLVNYPLTPHSKVQIASEIDNATLARIPFFRIAEEFLKIIQRDEVIKLTPLGALPKKYMVELYSYKFIEDYMIESGITKLTREQDCNSIQSARIVCELAGLAKKANGQQTLTKKGKELIKPENRQKLYFSILSTFTEVFSWGFNDAYPEDPVGQEGWAYSVYLLNKYGGDEHASYFYSEKYLKLLPHSTQCFDEGIIDSLSSFHRCYHIRTVERFFVWFGFIPTKVTRTSLRDSHNHFFYATDLVHKVFVFV